MAEGRKYLVGRTEHGHKEHIFNISDVAYGYCGVLIDPTKRVLKRSIHSKKICVNCKGVLFKDGA